MSDTPLGPEADKEIPNPMAVYEQSGERALRERLATVDRDALEAIVQNHPPHHTTPPSLQTLSREELIGYIIDGVKRAAGEE